MNRLVVVKRLGYEALRRLDNLRYRARRLSIVSRPRNALEYPGKRIYGRISMVDPSGTQRQISSISKFVTPMHPSVQSSICEDYADKDNYRAHHWQQFSLHRSLQSARPDLQSRF